MPGVVGVRGVADVHDRQRQQRARSSGAPAAWTDLGVTGAGQTIAVIDTGIDYPHANFGGAGTRPPTTANDRTVIEPGSFPTAKVVGGWDFVGNDYDATGDNGSVTPVPDPDPLDCAGHGSHVAGTAAGDGVLRRRHRPTPAPTTRRLQRPRSRSARASRPQAKLVALKVFGCAGSTDVVVDALNWVADYNAHHADAIDVVNMSLGAPFGRADNPDAVATNNLVNAGVVVVASAGNSGPNAYITGSPAAATQAISVAAEDTLATFPGAIVDFATAHGHHERATTRTPTRTCPSAGRSRSSTAPPAVVSLGCTAADYGTLPANTVVAIQRGVCPFVDKGAAAQAAGAIGIIDINRDDIANPAELPTFIGYNPEIFDIPMVGVGRGSKAGIIAADGQAVTLKAGGDRRQPDVQAARLLQLGRAAQRRQCRQAGRHRPGQLDRVDARRQRHQGHDPVGHVDGLAAHRRHRRPRPRRQPDLEPARGQGRDRRHRVGGNCGHRPLQRPDRRLRRRPGPQGRRHRRLRDDARRDGQPVLRLRPDDRGVQRDPRDHADNTSGSPITYNLSAGASIVSVSPAAVTVAGPLAVDRQRDRRAHDGPARRPAVRLEQPRRGRWRGAACNTFRGAVVATPTTSGGGRLQPPDPVHRGSAGLSNVTAGSRSAYTGGGIRQATIPLTNSGVHAGFADVYAWGLSDPQDLPATAIATNDIRAVGVQVLPGRGPDRRPRRERSRP